MLCRSALGFDCLGEEANAVDLAKEYFDFDPPKPNEAFKAINEDSIAFRGAFRRYL